MNFVLSADPQFTTTVDVTAPTIDGPQEQSFTARFRARTIEELPNRSEFDAEATRQFLREVLVGWGEDLVDDKGGPIPFSEAMRDVLIDTAWVRLPLVRAYFRGLQPAARGN